MPKKTKSSNQNIRWSRFLLTRHFAFDTDLSANEVRQRLHAWHSEQQQTKLSVSDIADNAIQFSMTQHGDITAKGVITSNEITDATHISGKIQMVARSYFMTWIVLLVMSLGFWIAFRDSELVWICAGFPIIAMVTSVATSYRDDHRQLIDDLYQYLTRDK